MLKKLIIAYILSLLIMLTGMGSNLLVIAVNGGMPVYGMQSDWGNWIAWSDNIKLPFLADVINQESIGDWFIRVGIVLFLGLTIALMGYAIDKYLTGRRQNGKGNSGSY